jgi:tRNA pseudouridine38-40 synthase
MEKFNIKMTLSYDGTNYCGFQSQVSGNTIEDNLKKVISKILKIDHVVLYCAGRTDSGVHARGQVINFHISKKNMNEDNWLHAMNSLLPADIRILSCEYVPMTFHSRRSAIAREYVYQLTNSPVISALSNRYSCHYRFPLDINLLQSYCKELIGEYDFTSFCSLSDTNKSKIRCIHLININKVDDLIIIKIIGNAFLYNMIRIIIGTIINQQKNNADAGVIRKILEAKNRKMAGHTFPAKGLIFNKVYYERNELAAAGITFT